MFGNVTTIDILRDDMKRQQDNTKEMWRLYEELRKKVNGLYEEDVHGTERPKVDILSDEVDIYELRQRIVELEKKK